MTEKRASSDIAESRRSKMIDLLKAYEDDTETLADRILAVVDQVERDTRERCARPKMMWGWDIEEIKSAMRQFQSKHPGKLPSEIERAERIRGKE